MTMLVTGATGTVGRHIVKQLVQQGKEVRAVSRNPQAANLPEGVQVVEGNLNEPDSLVPALEGVTALHLITSSDEAYGTLQTDPRIIELAAKAGVKRVTVLVGFEEGPVEAALRNSEMEWTLLKPGEFMANILVDWRESIRAEGVVREPFGHALSARIHEADTARVAVTALVEEGHHGQDYFLTGPEALSRIDAVRTISEVTGRDIRFEELSEERARDKWREQGYDEESIEFFVQMGKNPPEIGYTVLPTVEEVTGHPAAALAQWVADHKDEFI